MSYSCDIIIENAHNIQVSAKYFVVNYIDCVKLINRDTKEVKRICKNKKVFLVNGYCYWKRTKSQLLIKYNIGDNTKEKINDELRSLNNVFEYNGQIIFKYNERVQSYYGGYGDYESEGHRFRFPPTTCINDVTYSYRFGFTQNIVKEFELCLQYENLWVGFTVGFNQKTIKNDPNASMDITMSFININNAKNVFNLCKNYTLSEIHCLIDNANKIKFMDSLRDKICKEIHMIDNYIMYDGKMVEIKKKEPKIKKECCVCMHKPKPIGLILPCLHKEFCYECVKDIEECPICRQSVSTVVSV